MIKFYLESVIIYTLMILCGLVVSLAIEDRLKDFNPIAMFFASILLGFIPVIRFMLLVGVIASVIKDAKKK